MAESADRRVLLAASADPAQPRDALALLQALKDAIRGTGGAVMPLSPRVAAAVHAGGSVPATVPSETALVIETSGSTGTPKRVALSGHGMVAAARATEAEIGRGHWLLALPVYYVAGSQVLVRCIVGGTEPVVLTPSFSPDEFVDAVRSLGSGPAHTALVPVQLQRLLDAEHPDVIPALRRFDTVLLGGQSAPRTLLDRVAEAGIRLVRTYGSTETCGGVVYDGRPIDGTALRLREAMLEISAPSLALGYLDHRGNLDEDLTSAAFVTDEYGRWFRSCDLAELGRAADGGQTVRVLGRADDVFISGGLKLALGEVQRVLESLPGYESAIALALPDDAWGQSVAIAVDGTRITAAPDGRMLHAALVERLGPAATPRRLLVLRDGIPRLDSGKPDRFALARAFAARRP